MDIKSYESHVPPKDELVASLGQGLKSYFADVTVELVECPDFNKHPFKMPIDGLNGKPTIVDVGGVHNLIPRVNLESHYNLKDVTKAIFKPSSGDYPIGIFGPGGGAFGTLGFCCEFMGSARYELEGDDSLKLAGCGCRYSYVDNEGKGQLREQQDDDRFGLMGNFYLSQNKSGQVVKVIAKRRIGKKNFTESIREVILAKYGADKPISMGGVFLINQGVAKLHIMPKYWPKEPSTPESVNNDWLKYYEITKHPLVCLSVFHSYDPGFGLRMEHTHCFNLDTTDEAGHYHYDVTPDTVEYEGYFNVAERVVRLDGPQGDALDL